MSADPAEKRDWTVAEYLDLERTCEVRHELHNGEIFAMSEGTESHSLIAVNVLRELSVALRARPCRVYNADMRVKVPATGLYTYPDVSALCSQPRFEGDERTTLLNPSLIVEVLSDSTEAYDRGRKFAHYRALESVEDYVLVSQSEPLVEHFVRQPDGGWQMRALRVGELLKPASLACAVRIEDLYLHVWPSPGSSG